MENGVFEEAEKMDVLLAVWLRSQGTGQARAVLVSLMVSSSGCRGTTSRFDCLGPIVEGAVGRRCEREGNIKKWMLRAMCTEKRASGGMCIPGSAG